MLSSTVKSFDDLPDILNADLVAQTLGISKTNTYYLMRGRDFPSFKLKKDGKRIFVTRVDFLAWIDEQVAKPFQDEPYL